jgi:hypothetical protein
MEWRMTATPDGGMANAFAPCAVDVRSMTRGS